jgi:hypothetical protein
VALVLIGVGLFFLLRETDVIPRDVSIGPIVLIALGAVLLVIALTTRFGEAGLVVPFVLLALGIVLLLRDRGAVSEDFSVWPAVLIAVGAGLLLGDGIGATMLGRRVRSVDRAIPVDGAREAHLEIRHGGGSLRVDPGSDRLTLLRGTFRGGVRDRIRRRGDRLEVRLESEGGRWLGWGSRRWDLELAPGIPISIDLQIGASDSALDLSALTVPSLDVHTGASHTRAVLPERGETAVRIQAGAASVDLVVPAGVAGRVRFQGGLASRKVDESRFPRTGNEYRSLDYETADNRVDVEVQGGAGSFTVR